MRTLVAAAALVGLVAAVSPGLATGLATCQSGLPSTWKSQDSLKDRLTGQGWQVRRIKVDGGCYEVYALNDKGERVEAYFHPVTFESVATERN